MEKDLLLKAIVYEKILNRAIQGKIVHIMLNDKFNKSFVNFLNQYFPNGHTVLFLRALDFQPPEGHNVCEIQHLNYDFSKAKALICHSLFIDGLTTRLYMEPELLKKSYWIVWGGDLYGAKRNTEDDFVRSNFRGYVTIDQKILMQNYTIRQNFFPLCYTMSQDTEVLNKALQQRSNQNHVHIQVNNSSCKTTLDILKTLSRFKNENIQITTITSYGDMSYAKQVDMYGKLLFGEKFKNLTEMLPPQEYADHLATVDVLILNQNRQQGGGNACLVLYLGGKVFIKQEITTFEYLTSLGIKLFDTNAITQMSFSELTDLSDADKEKNKKMITPLLDRTYTRKVWGKIFNDIEKI